MNNHDVVLDYLKKIPSYPFDADIDPDFVSELAEDFQDIDILEA